MIAFLLACLVIAVLLCSSAGRALLGGLLVCVLITVGLFILFLFAEGARANELERDRNGELYQWRRVAVVDDYELEVVEVTRRKMQSLARRYETHASPAGFTVLLRIDGAYVCRVYLSPIADGRVLEHELRHCQGWTH